MEFLKAFAAAALLAAGCAPSPLLRPDDATFAAADVRFAAVSESILGQAGPRKLDAQEALFLRAEALYDYRFALTRGGTASSYLAQLAAAATDFAPFTVVAASGGLFELRLRAYDGAAQLYEAFLERYPSSRLRPLALYRLGWAYRSRYTEGFPRGPDEALAQLEREFPHSPLATLVPDARATPWKSQDTAALWSLLPGAGQIYVGETGNGLARLTIASAFAALAIVPLVVLVKNHSVEWLPIVLSTAGFIGLQVSYTAALQDAQRGVLNFNERAGRGCVLGGTPGCAVGRTGSEHCGSRYALAARERCLASPPWPPWCSCSP